MTQPTNMARPKTPETLSSSAGGASTPSSHAPSTPPTDHKNSKMARAAFVSRLQQQTVASSYNEPPGLRYHVQSVASRASDESADQDPVTHLSSSSSKTVVPIQRHLAGSGISNYAAAVGGSEQLGQLEQAQRTRIPQFLVQTPTPAAPIRQPIAPPADHAASVNTRQEMDASVWEGLTRFSRLSMNEQTPVARRVQASETPQQASFSPIWSTPVFNERQPSSEGIVFNNQRQPSAETIVYQAPAAQQQQPSPPRGFRPMAAIAHVDRTIGTRINPREVAPADPRAFSSNYRGEHSARNASVDDLPYEQNCALWLTNLPPNVNCQQLLAQIRGIGRIWCTVINKPDYDRHNTAAAKVVFFTPAPAQRLLQQSLTQGLEVSGYAVRVTHNRVKYGAQTLTGNASRVLIVTGKTTFVNPESLSEFFSSRFVFEVDEIIELINQGNRHKGGRSVVEYRFGSFRCQAQMGKMALEKDRPEGFEKVDFGPDPCEVGDTLASYGIAAQRIQGIGI